MKSLKGRLDVEYSNLTEHKFQMEGTVQDLSSIGRTLYQVDLTATHPASRLDLGARGTVSIRPAEYQARGDATYKRSFLGLQNGHILAKVDANAKLFNLEVSR